MKQIVSITSQGQISIPASMRRLMAFDQYHKALVKLEGKKIVIEPIADFLSLGGTLQQKAKKTKKINEIIKTEEKIIGKMIK